jgi:hypothetical protein
LKARSGDRLAAALALVLLACAPAMGQNDDVPLPPRVDAPGARPTPGASTSIRAPDRARLAPLPEERRATTDEIIVIGGSQWRLPDLGSAWRAEQEEAARSGARVQATLLPLYEPGSSPTRNDTFLLNREVERIGYIELFRVRFGRGSRQ